MEIYSCEVLLTFKSKIHICKSSRKQWILLKRADSWALTIKENFSQDKIDHNGQI